jgi:hypothetical protein
MNQVILILILNFLFHFFNYANLNYMFLHGYKFNDSFSINKTFQKIIF